VRGFPGRRALRRLGQVDPEQLRARKDMDVGRHSGRLVESPDANEEHRLAPAIVAPQRRLAGGTARHVMRAAAVGRQRDDLGRAVGCDVLRLDERVDDEGAPGLALAIGAVAAMHEHRRRVEAIFHRAAEALPLQRLRHLAHPPVPNKCENFGFNSRLSKPSLSRSRQNLHARETQDSRA